MRSLVSELGDIVTHSADKLDQAHLEYMKGFIIYVDRNYRDINS